MIDARYALSIKIEKDISGNKSGHGRRSARCHLRHHHGIPFGTTQGAGHAPIQGDGLTGNSEFVASHTAVAHQRQGDIDNRVYSDRKTNALRAADHGSVDADDLAG